MTAPINDRPKLDDMAAWLKRWEAGEDCGLPPWYERLDHCCPDCGARKDAKEHHTGCKLENAK